MKLKSYIIKRLILLLPMLLGISFITWFLSDIAGDPLAPFVSPSDTVILTDAPPGCRATTYLDPTLTIPTFHINFRVTTGIITPGDIWPAIGITSQRRVPGITEVAAHSPTISRTTQLYPG